MRHSSSALFCSMVLFDVQARADITWEAPSGCSNKAEIVRRAAALAGPGAREIDGEAHVEKRESSYHARLLVRGEARELDGESCEAIVEAAALVFGLAMKVDVQEKPREAPVPAAGGEAPPTREKGRWLVSFGGGIDSGTTARFGLGPSLGFGWLRGPLRVEARSSFLLSPDASIAKEKGASFSFLRGDIRGCFAPKAGAFELGPCGTIGGGALFSSGFGSQGDASATAWLGELGLGATLTVVPAPRFALRLDGFALARVPKATFVISGLGEVHSTDFIGFSTELTGEARF